MRELYDGIYSHFDTVNTLNTALSGNLYPHEVSDTVGFPHAAYFLIFGDNDYDFSDDKEDILIQFSLFSEKNSPVEITTLYGYLTDLFDDAEITVSGWRALRFQRTNSSLLRDEVQNTWAYHVDYSVWLERNR